MESSELEQLLSELEPDAHALLAALCDLIDEEDLVEVSRAEGMGQDEHLRALRRIVLDRKAPQNISWRPGEACEMMRWRDPRVFDPDQLISTSETDRRQHRQRAFACAILLSSNVQRATELENTDAAPLLGSAIVLGAPVISLTRRCLAACASTSTIDESERPFYLLGTLICLVAEDQPHSIQQRIRLVRLIEEAEAAARELEFDPPSEWLFGLTCFDQHFDLWRSLVHHLLVEPQRPHPPEADAALRRLGRMILDGAKS